MIFGQQPKESPDELANRLTREGKIDQLEQELQRYRVTKLSEKDKEAYYHLWGIGAFRRRDRAEAFRRFQEGLQACPNSQNLLFQLGQEYEHRREIERMFECFDKCSFPKVGSKYMLATARYAYLWNRAEQGDSYVQPIAEAYFKLGIADDNAVYIRGLPFFSQTWHYLVAFAWMKNDFRPTDDYIDRAARSLSDYDFESTLRFYACVKNDNYAPAIQDLETRLRQWDSRLPSGYLRIQLAALKARRAENVESAFAALGGVSFGANDFPWLADILTIQRAWAYARSGDASNETVELDRFLARQPLLFEPDHAVAFAFLPYQEALKHRYQTRIGV